ncbi:putative Transposon TX1 [Gossypium australe]|uniref:Putative Transposon TX1 n=1 Tax=Gossypium australe TaxID=47621 RepID=A0A5B6UR75_9ROSI|nr:putative Transposon TX1 [Gossypium australe]
MSKCWWRNPKTNKGIHWCKWSDLCPQSEGRSSIWSARQIIMEGMGWRVGNGESINIGTISSCRCLGVEEYNKQDTIRSLFGEEQLKSILSIPLVSSRPHDQLIWRGDNIGTYTVKRGYKWINTTVNSRLDIDNPTTFYTKLWGLKIPSKIRILMWRIANEFIPTLYNLRIRKLGTNSLCPVCQIDEETMSHLFKDCTFTQQVLRRIGVPDATCNREPNWKKMVRKSS